jgi:glycosyltransferase involved in cell wall biosynthesis
MKVCYLINQLAPGGAPTLLLDLVKNSPKEISHTVCFIEGDDSLVPELRSAGVEIVDFDAQFKFDPRALYRMFKVFNNNEYDVLHAHLPYSQTLGRLCGTYGGCDSIISTQHNVPENYHPITRTLEYITRPLDSATVAVSEGVEEGFRGDSHQYDGTLDGQWCTIYNGIDVEKFRNEVSESDVNSVTEQWSLNDGPIFLNIARYTPPKSQVDLVEAMETVVAELPESQLFIVGWGELENKLRTRVAEFGLEDHITISGRVPEVYPYFSLADVFVSSSVFEGLPISLIEASASSLPIVATDIRGVREVIDEGENGFLVPPNSPAELGDAMVRMVEEEISDYGKASLQKALDKFSIEETTDKYTNIYRGNF